MYSSLYLPASSLSISLFLFFCATPICAFPLTLVNRADLASTTQEDLAVGRPCKAITVIFARGTTEPGNVGQLAGPPMFQALADIVGADQLAIQGVEYPADVPGFLHGGDTEGSKAMTILVNKAAKKCPETAIVMCGYSQGGQLVHKTAEKLDAETAKKVSSVVIFGDPDNGYALPNIPASKIKVFCHAADNICDHGIIILPAHLSYGRDAKDAAKFVATAANMA